VVVDVDGGGVGVKGVEEVIVDDDVEVPGADGNRRNVLGALRLGDGPPTEMFKEVRDDV
jgi:hypothetical protein